MKRYKRYIGRVLGTFVCIALLYGVATLDRNFHGSPAVEAKVPSAIGEIGGRLPDFILPDIDGTPVSLSEFAHGGRVLLTFERSLDW